MSLIHIGPTILKVVHQLWKLTRHPAKSQVRDLPFTVNDEVRSEGQQPHVARHGELVVVKRGTSSATVATLGIEKTG